ncbi:MAG: UbiA family prenyltransferase [Chloroflexi bacterium]|nr:UbiA family prenyltransferase [Chloroflexota bacterium]
MEQTHLATDRSLSVQQVAARLGVTPVTVYRHLRRGTLPHFRFGGTLRVLETDLDAFIQRGRRHGVSPIPPERANVPTANTLPQRSRAWAELVRPSSWTASLVPVLLGTAIAWKDGHLNPILVGLALVGATLLHAATNVINELFDVRQGVDAVESAGGSKMVAQARLLPGEVYKGGLLLFGMAVLVGAYLATVRGYYIVLVGTAAVLAGYFYTAPPFHYKYRALGVPVVLVMMGPLMVLGTYFVMTGTVTAQAVLASIPVGVLVASIFHAKDIRDVENDARAGSTTLATLMGQRSAGRLYTVMTFGCYAITVLLVALRTLPAWSLITLLALLVAMPASLHMERGTRPQGGPTLALAAIDTATVRHHLLFGVLLSIAFVLQRATSSW